ncbi:MAG: lipopolysaccharide kinase InaA family protein [Steroidobacteraceae bacterium]
MTAYDTYDHALIKAEPTTLIWSEPLAGGGRAVVKMYRHRSLHDPLRRLAVPYRVAREFGLLARLREHAVSCPEPLWWSHGHSRVHGLHEILATREIAGAAPLAWLLRAGAQPPDLAPLFLLARRMHECGISHGAFYPANVLVETPALYSPTYHLIDLAHGCRFATDIVGTRPAMFDLLDMLRTIERMRPLEGCAQWIAGYGLGADATRRLLERLVQHRVERPWRHLHRAETDLRAAWNRVSRPAASRVPAAATQNQPGRRPG